MPKKKNEDSFWGNSECLDAWLHRFQIIQAYEQGILERCEICHLEVFFPVVNGSIDNLEYLSYHARQALMPQHPYFKHEYEHTNR